MAQSIEEIKAGLEAPTHNIVNAIPRITGFSSFI